MVITVDEKYRAKLGNYLLAEMEIRILLYMYYEMTAAELKKTNVIKDVDDYFKKWCSKIPMFKKLRKYLHNEIAEENYGEDDILNAYRNYLEVIYGTIYTINDVKRQIKAERISSKIVDGVQEYYDNHY